MMIPAIFSQCLFKVSTFNLFLISSFNKDAYYFGNFVANGTVQGKTPKYSSTVINFLIKGKGRISFNLDFLPIIKTTPSPKLQNLSLMGVQFRITCLSMIGLDKLKILLIQVALNYSDREMLFVRSRQGILSVISFYKAYFAPGRILSFKMMVPSMSIATPILCLLMIYIEKLQ